MDISAHISQYLQITGRPAATLTVDEYVKFVQIAGISIETTKENNVQTPEHSAEPANNVRRIESVPKKEMSPQSSETSALKLLMSIPG